LGAALAAFEAGCAANPRYAQAKVQLGITLTMLDQKEAARDAFKAAIELDPDHKVAAMYLRLAEGRKG